VGTVYPDGVDCKHLAGKSPAWWGAFRQAFEALDIFGRDGWVR
jgi:hypothetical protein